MNLEGEGEHKHSGYGKTRTIPSFRFEASPKSPQLPPWSSTAQGVCI